MDQVKMGALHSILTKTKYDPGFMIDEDSFGYVAFDDGPWVQMVPDEMVANLARLSESKIRPIADEWLKTDEFQNAAGFGNTAVGFCCGFDTCCFQFLAKFFEFDRNVLDCLVAILRILRQTTPHYSLQVRRREWIQLGKAGSRT